MNAKLEILLQETGQKLNISKEEITHVLKSRKKTIIASAIFVFAFFALQSIQYGPLRYAPSSIQDFFQMGKFF